MCPSSDAYHLYDDGHGYCFSCEYFKPAKEVMSDEIFTYEYIPLRGVQKRTLEFYGALTKISPEGVPISIGFKYPNGAYKVRNLDKKEFFWSGEDVNKAGLFGRDKFAAGSHKYVTITEGEIDALSLYQTLASPVVSVHSASSALRDCTMDRSWLNSFERVYLAFDDDTSGRDATRACARLFDYNKVFVVRFSPRKDANEWLQVDGGADELRNIWKNSKRYLPETVISSFDDFRKILSGSSARGVAYPFPTLTDMTYGIRKGESVLITAQEGIGKTEIMHAIEYNLLKETDDAIGAIFLEETKRQHLQAIAGLELKRPVHLPDSGVTTDEIMAAVEKAVKTDDRLHVYSHFGSDDPEVLLDTIRFMVGARDVGYVLLDHITMAVSGLAGEDERRALDYLVTRLEMMVKELNFALIFVSHVNDLGQTRGSRYIGKIADTRIDLSRDLMSNSDTERNSTSLFISKNRPIGRTGFAGKYLFDPYTRQFTETMVADNDSNISSGYSSVHRAA